jgi:single stranded DNA-binding protein (ssb)
VLPFFIGINKKWRDQDGNQQESAAFPACVAWGHRAQFIEKYFRKGDPILVEGELATRQYDDNDGKRHYVTEVKVLNVGFVGARSSNRNSGGGYEDLDTAGFPPEDDYSGDADVPF